MYLLGRAREFVAAVGAASALHQFGVAEADDELLEVGPRQVFLLGDVRQAGGPVSVPLGELRHQPHAVLALRGEGNGAGAVIRPRSQLDSPLRRWVGSGGRPVIPT